MNESARASYTTENRRVVVLLEDDDLDAELLVERLAAEGLTFDVRRARDEASFRALLRPGVSLVLSDFNLPTYDGVSALEAARTTLPDVPFLFVSGAIGEERAIDAMRRGATDYVLKDRLERLAPAVRRALAEADDKRLRRHAEEERDRLLVSERNAREAAEAANRMKDEFLAVVSHELRTPLNAILGWASLLDPSSDAKTLERGLTTIRRNATVQARLIEDILDISRIITGKLQLRSVAVPVATFVEAAIESVRHAATAKAITLDVVIAEDAGSIVGDADRLQQVVWNLVSNAVKFTPPRGKVEVRARRESGALEIVVRDTGGGIPADLLPHVFERFRQGDATKTRAHGGLGLGLAIVRHLVELHGGTVQATSAGVGRGSQFTVSLPIRATAAATSDDPPPSSVADEPSSASAPRSSTDANRLRGLRVLVVDDEPDARDLVTQVLEGCGADVTTTASVLDALRELAKLRHDVVVSDIGMPLVDGYSLIRRIRALSAADGGATPAIALTAYSREEDRREAQAAGYQRHIAKPVPLDTLVTAVAELAGRG